MKPIINELFENTFAQTNPKVFVNVKAVVPDEAIVAVPPIRGKAIKLADPRTIPQRVAVHTIIFFFYFASSLDERSKSLVSII